MKNQHNKVKNKLFNQKLFKEKWSQLNKFRKSNNLKGILELFILRKINKPLNQKLPHNLLIKLKLFSLQQM